MSDEVALAGKALDEVLSNPAAREFLSRLTGEPASEVGGLLGDRIRWWRFKQIVNLSEKARRLLEERGLDAQSVPPSVLVPLLEAGSLADDEGLQDRWATLLANAATDPGGVPPSFPFILGQLTPTEAKLLDLIFEGTNHSEQPGRVVNTQEAAGEGVAGRDLELAVDNLIRLRVVYSPTTYGGLVSDSVGLTTLGDEFVRACSPPTATPG